MSLSSKLFVITDICVYPLIFCLSRPNICDVLLNKSFVHIQFEFIYSTGWHRTETNIRNKVWISDCFYMNIVIHKNMHAYSDQKRIFGQYVTFFLSNINNTNPFNICANHGEKHSSNFFSLIVRKIKFVLPANRRTKY